MTELFQKIKTITEKINPWKSFYPVKRIRPSRDWLILLFFTLFVFCLGVIFEIWFYIQVSRGNIFNISRESAKEEIKINSTLFLKTVEEINLRQSMLVDIKNKRISYPDPSI